MSFWSALSAAWRLGNEYTGAVSAARDALERDESLTQVVQAFADATESRLDDIAAAELVRGLKLGVEYARRAALIAGRVAAAIETHAPPVLASVKRAMDSAAVLADRAALESDRVREIAAVAGVASMRLAMRLERMSHGPSRRE